MLTFFPKYFSSLAIGAYFLSLILVSFIYMDYAMQWYWWVIGGVEVVGFFYLANYLTKAWHDMPTSRFTRQLFWWSFALRFAFMLFLYWFHTKMTGMPFVFHPADVLFYHEAGKYGHILLSNGEDNFFRAFMHYLGTGYSDSGYAIWLSFVYWVFDDSIFMSRVIKCLLGAWMCVLVYKVANRNFGEGIARMAAVFCMLMPNFLYYCGIQLKECEMVFLIVAFIERADYIIRSRQFVGLQFVLTLALGVSLFFFRTVLGAAAIMAFILALLLTSQRVARISQRWVILIVVALIGTYFVGGKIAMEVEEIWNARKYTQSTNMEWRAEREGGNTLAKYASAAIFAPMIFAIPFPTYVETPNQENQRMMHGANFIKNILSCLCLFGVFMMVFRNGRIHDFMKGPWREYVLLLAIMLGYLLILVFSSFAHSERFHMPALPFELIFAAVGVSYISKKKYRTYYLLWCGLMVVAAIAWSWFKLRGRGMV